MRTVGWGQVTLKSVTEYKLYGKFCNWKLIHWMQIFVFISTFGLLQKL